MPQAAETQREEECEEGEPSWKDKPLHGMYHRQIEEESDIEKSMPAMQLGRQTMSTEALVKSRP